MVSIPSFVFLVLVLLILAFLTGYASFAHIFVKQLREGDIRQYGNGGATNASPLSGRKLLIVILALDALQGMATAWLLPEILWLLADLGGIFIAPVNFYNDTLFLKSVQFCMGMAAFLGRYYSSLLGVKGGKGVAMALGVSLVVSWKATVLIAVAVAVIRLRANITCLLKDKKQKAVAQKDSTIQERRYIPQEVKREVWNRDKGKCTECGSEDYLEYDHIIPVSKGGSNTVRNIQLLCSQCNRRKSANI